MPESASPFTGLALDAATVQSLEAVLPRMAERTGQYTIAVRAWHEAARLGDTRAADGMAKVAPAADCEFTRTALEHARALAAER